MRTWAWMTGGLLLWAVHFLGVYGLASLADVVSRADDPVWRAVGLVFSGACLLAAAILLTMSFKRLRRSADGRSRFPDQLAALGAGLALVAIAWQTLPTIIGY